MGEWQGGKQGWVRGWSGAVVVGGSSAVGGSAAEGDGGHDAAKALAQLQRGVRRHLGRLCERLDLRRAVEQLGEEVGQLLLKISCKRRWVKGLRSGK